MTTTERPPSEATGTTPAPRARDPLWDNVRWVAITLVVVGHMIEVPNGNDLAFGVYLAIYAFHMPLFAFAAGRFARGGSFGLREGAVLVRQVVAPYVVFQVVWATMNWWQRGREDFALDLLTPYWLMWFLFSLAVWRLSLPVFAALRFPVAVSLVIACASGLWASAGTPFAASRTLVFLPFFVAGWAWYERGRTDRALGLLRRLPVRVLAALVLVGTVWACVRYADLARELQLRKWVQGEWNYERLGYLEWWAPGMRLAVLLAAFVLIACVLSVTPRLGGPIARAGRRTMTVYLLHLLPIVYLQRTGRLPWLADADDRQVLLLVGAGVLWSALLSTRAVEWLASPLVSPPVAWLLGRLPSRT